MVTFAACLLIRLELGIVIGIGVNLIFLLYASARPAVRVTQAVSTHGVQHVVAVVDRSLAFPSAEYVRRALRKAAERHPDAPRVPLVIDATHVQACDFTAAKVSSRYVARVRIRNSLFFKYSAPLFNYFTTGI